MAVREAQKGCQLITECVWRGGLRYIDSPSGIIGCQHNCSGTAASRLAGCRPEDILFPIGHYSFYSLAGILAGLIRRIHAPPGLNPLAKRIHHGALFLIHRQRAKHRRLQDSKIRNNTGMSNGLLGAIIINDSVTR